MKPRARQSKQGAAVHRPESGIRHDAAVIGAGPAGARAAWRLASGGLRVLLLDHRYPWEKPCGGGLNERAFTLLSSGSSSFPQKDGETDITIRSPAGRELLIRGRSRIRVLSRARLQQLMVGQALEAGVVLVTERVTVLRAGRLNGPWELVTGGGRHFRADLLVGADGANSMVRRTLSKDHQLPRFPLAFGLVRAFSGRPTGGAGLTITFSDSPPGYLWEFPDDQFSTVGFSLPFGPAGARSAVEAVRLRLKEMPTAGGLGNECIHRIRGAFAPAAPPAYWDNAPFNGPGWALLGDAAGLADPLTGEGIYHALKSADLLAAAVRAGRLDEYGEAVHEEIGRELSRAAVYAPGFFASGFTERMIALSERHGGIRRVMADLFTGRQGYRGLRRRLLVSSAPAALTYLMGRMMRRP